MAANLIAAFLFGICHIVMPFRSYMNGEMSFAAMALMSVGYIILAGIMGSSLPYNREPVVRTWRPPVQ